MTHLNERSYRKKLEVIARQAMLDHGFQPDLPATAAAELKSIASKAERDSTVRDLTDLPWISIDNDDSLDLDQLSVAVEQPGASGKLLLAIADVDELVPLESAIDEHAQTNTTSIYTPVGVFPMLPEQLSHGLTSLLPDGPRQAMVIEMIVDSDGGISSSNIYRGRVHNRAKLIYEDVAELLEGKNGRAFEPEVASQLKLQDRIAQALRKSRFAEGALNFETVEPRVVIRESDEAVVGERRKNRARELIEDLMIAGNGATARFLESKGYFSIRRVVRSPERWDRIRIVAEDQGGKLPPEPDSLALEEFLSVMRKRDPLRFPDLSLSIIKLLGNGAYEVERPGDKSMNHFGLAVRDYAHSTAPNRRYSDLITQRLLKAALQNAAAPYTEAKLHHLAAHCTEREDEAVKVERQLVKAAAAFALSGRIGQRFDAIVTGASSKGTWVRILHPPVEGKLVDGWKGVDVGDKLRVKLIATDPDRGFIDFVRVRR